MKNIHILPTDKPSRLSILNSGKLDFGAEIMSSSNSKPQHIYITSNEEIKDEDYVLSDISVGVLYLDGKINTASMLAKGQWKKVVLTTDQELIKDGVQSIDDAFLEWFIKNPSCEEVEVEVELELVVLNEYGSVNSYGVEKFGYKIIIPKEEPKKLTDLEIAIKLEEIEREELKQERMYSEEEVKEMKQTAVDFAVEQLEKLIPNGNQIIIGIILDKAKEMEKEQIITARQDGLDNGFSNGSWDSNLYYKKNYEQKIERL